MGILLNWKNEDNSGAKERGKWVFPGVEVRTKFERGKSVKIQ